MRQRSQAILLKEWPFFHPHETLNLNVEVFHFHKTPPANLLCHEMTTYGIDGSFLQFNCIP